MDIETADIKAARLAFAEELRYVAHVQSNRVIDAFATVPRERFLGDRPWRVYDFVDGYWEAPGDDPRSAYHNVLFAIDAARELNNGQPQFWARLLDKLEIRAGDKVYHVGAGTGYYTAIMAELAGPDGAVIAVEIDPALAERARANLASRANIQIAAADGASFDPGPVDVIVINAGVTHPMPAWRAALRPAGRALLPLTADGGQGVVFRIERLADPDRYGATAVSSALIYPCAGARSIQAERLFARALGQGGQRFVRSLRLDAHAHDSTCWLHGDGYCLSTRP
ncbi:protein-L-isoaspartate O-methyltransferase [Methylocapsa sp. S129]|uniref:protein-L-isoaspartate O-methyltransferase family protein n=1 Tax=Methylocapsa sp. S129 TaxID=1641869 RepID=UPI00131B77B7|nr:methyltransferase domain-containing protein [Methylocapsa sp. S129]